MLPPHLFKSPSICSSSHPCYWTTSDTPVAKFCRFCLTKSTQHRISSKAAVTPSTLLRAWQSWGLKTSRPSRLKSMLGLCFGDCSIFTSQLLWWLWIQKLCKQHGCQGCFHFQFSHVISETYPGATCCSGAKAAFTATLAQATSSLVRLEGCTSRYVQRMDTSGVCVYIYICIHMYHMCIQGYLYIHTANIVSIHMHLKVSSTVYTIDTNWIVMKLEQ